MARVTQQKSTRHHGPSSSARGAQISKQRNNNQNNHNHNNKKQKIVLKGNAQGQNGSSDVVSAFRKTVRGQPARKSRVDPRQLSFHTEPPPGYTFIPAGNPQLTTALKEFAKSGNHKIFSVSVRLSMHTLCFAKFDRQHPMLLDMSCHVRSIVSAFTFPHLLWHRYAITMAFV